MDEIIYGKNPIERITNIEVLEDVIELHTEGPSGVSVIHKPHKFWALSHNDLGDGIKLQGDLHYKYGYQFGTRKSFLSFRQRNRQSDIYSVYNPAEAAMIKYGYTLFKGMQISDVSVLSFDIETTGFLDQGNKLLLISNTFRKNGKVQKRLFAYDDYKSEGAMLLDWCAWVRQMDPTVVCGHNIISFDLPFLEEVADRENVMLALGRDDSALTFDNYESKFRKDGSQFYTYFRAHIFGRDIVDTLFLSIKHDATARKYNNYQLKNIIKEEGLEKPGRVFYDASQIKAKYKTPSEWVKIKEYCNDDSDDALSIFDLAIKPFFYMAQSVPKTLQQIIEGATGSQLNALLIRSYLQKGHSIPKADEAEHFAGAISRGNPGIYENCYKVDVAALYPSIILQYDVYEPKKDPNAHFLHITKEFTAFRLKYKDLYQTTKKEEYKNISDAFKILANSIYGLCGATGLNFNCVDKAAFITQTGREVLEQAIKWTADNDLDLVNCDTDSILFCRKDRASMPEPERVDYLNRINALYPPKIRMADDGYYTKVIVLKAKNYALWNGTKLKIKGSALKSSTKETALKELIGEIIQTILDDKKDYLSIYHKYIRRAKFITTKEEMKKWSSKKTITEKVLAPERTNEKKILDAIDEDEVQEGDKIWVFFKEDGSLCLADGFTGEYDAYRLIEKIWKTYMIFENVLDKKEFIKYHLKTKRKFLDNEMFRAELQQTLQ